MAYESERVQSLFDQVVGEERSKLDKKMRENKKLKSVITGYEETINRLREDLSQKSELEDANRNLK